jgi:GNAT superfamily N-acetyltransferase
MKEPGIIVEPNPPRAWVEAVEHGLRSHNTAMTGLVDYYPVGLVIRDSRNSLVGGLIGNTMGGWLHVRSLWVELRSRGRGFASDLMAAAESYARSRNCIGAFLKTASYEARPLYEQLGYRVFAELKDHPVKGHDRFFLAKHLTASGAESTALPGRSDIMMEPYATAETQAIIQRGIQTHAHAAIGLPEQAWAVANIFLRNEAGEIVGGAMGDEWGDWLHLFTLWIAPPLRGQRQASRLMTAIENHAVQGGCVHSFLDTFNAAARPIYEKRGFEIFGVLENHPIGFTHYFMRKRLD